MKFKNLNNAINKWMQPFFSEEAKMEILQAAEMDFKSMTDSDAIMSNPVDKDWLLFKYNEIFNRKSRIISDAVLKKYKKVFATFTKAEIEMAMRAAKQDEFHASKKFQHCTLEYFSRVDQIDKWFNLFNEQMKSNKGFVLPKFNVREDI
jgi:hypothetical protein